MERTFAHTAVDAHTLMRGSRSRSAWLDSFWSQTPLALLAIGAVVAIIAVNRPVPAPAPEPVRVAVTPVLVAEIDSRCTECGEIVSVELVSLHPDTAPSIKTFELNVRMSDGTLRTIRQFAPVFDIGDRVRVNAGTVAQRG
jgi:hypothetical protein